MVKTPPSNAGAESSTLGWGARNPHALQPKKQNIKQKQYCDKFSKDFKNGPYQKTYLKNIELLPSFMYWKRHVLFKNVMFLFV